MDKQQRDPETVIQQLRLLLAAKEEELGKLRGTVGGSENQEAEESVVNRLIKEIDEKKAEIEELNGKLKKLSDKANERLSEMAEEIEEQQRVIDSLQKGGGGTAPAGSAAAVAKVAELESALKRKTEEAQQAVEEITAQLEEKERVIAGLEERLRGQGEAEPGAAHAMLEEKEREIAHLKARLSNAEKMVSELEAPAADEMRAQAEVDELKEAVEAERERAADTKRFFEGQLAQLKQQVIELERERDNALAAATGAGGDGSAIAEMQARWEEEKKALREAMEEKIAALREERERALQEARDTDTRNDEEILAGLRAQLEEENAKLLLAKDEELTEARKRLSDVEGQLRSLEEEAGETERSYWTVQAQLHRMNRVQQVLKGAVAGLGIFLILALVMRNPQPEKVVVEVPAPPDPITLAGSVVTAPEEEENTSPAILDEEGVDDTLRAADEDEIMMLAGRESHSLEEPVQVSEPEPQEEEKPARIAYTVKKGDSLWRICMRELGDPRAVNRIARDNNLSDPGSLRVGDVIYLSKK